MSFVSLLPPRSGFVEQPMVSAQLKVSAMNLIFLAKLSGSIKKRIIFIVSVLICRSFGESQWRAQGPGKPDGRP